ncbi:MAG: nitroreductase family protein [Nitrospirae bacterium]|nr:nitroreductase family protein [Nitrospirota bacterium]
MIIKEIIKRRSVRDFRSDNVNDNMILEIIKAAQFAPTGMNNRAIEFIIVKDKAIKEALHNIAGQSFLSVAPVLIVPIINGDKSITPVQDISIASTQMMLQITSLGLGTVWKHLQDSWVVKIKQLLNIPANFILINILPVGFPDTALPEHSDTEFNKNAIHYDKF